MNRGQQWKKAARQRKSRRRWVCGSFRRIGGRRRRRRTEPYRGLGMAATTVFPLPFPFPPFPFSSSSLRPHLSSWLTVAVAAVAGRKRWAFFFQPLSEDRSSQQQQAGRGGGTSCQPPTTDRWPQEDQRRFFLQNGRKRKLSSTILLPLRSRAHFREKRLLGLFLVGASGWWRRRRIKYSEGGGRWRWALELNQIGRKGGGPKGATRHRKCLFRSSRFDAAERGARTGPRGKRDCICRYIREGV